MPSLVELFKKSANIASNMDPLYTDVEDFFSVIDAKACGAGGKILALAYTTEPCPPPAAESSNLGGIIIVMPFFVTFFVILCLETCACQSSLPFLFPERPKVAHTSLLTSLQSLMPIVMLVCDVNPVSCTRTNALAGPRAHTHAPTHNTHVLINNRALVWGALRSCWLVCLPVCTSKTRLKSKKTAL